MSQGDHVKQLNQHEQLNTGDSIRHSIDDVNE
jgi:hypothetical protein